MPLRRALPTSGSRTAEVEHSRLDAPDAVIALANLRVQGPPVARTPRNANRRGGNEVSEGLRGQAAPLPESESTDEAEDGCCTVSPVIPHGDLASRRREEVVPMKKGRHTAPWREQSAGRGHACPAAEGKARTIAGTRSRCNSWSFKNCGLPLKTQTS